MEMGLQGCGLRECEEARKRLAALRTRQRKQTALDYRGYLEQMAEQAKQAYEECDMREVWRLEKKLQFKGKVPAKAKGLADKNGVMHTAVAEIAEIFHEYFAEKLHARAPSGGRREPAPVPEDFRVTLEEQEELARGWARVKKGKAAGPDNFVKEIYMVLPEW
eukprot:9066646-Lingulodinium_polyedra.AAC.1